MHIINSMLATGSIESGIITGALIAEAGLMIVIYNIMVVHACSYSTDFKPELSF